MLPYRCIFYDATFIRENSEESFRNAPVFSKNHFLGGRQPLSKTVARKLVHHIFVKNYCDDELKLRPRKTKSRLKQLAVDGDRLQVTSAQSSYGSVCHFTSDLKTRLPHHLLPAISVAFHLLKNCRKSYIKMKLEKYCPNEVLKENPQICDLVRAHSLRNRVFLFLRSVLRKILPKKVWGSKKNDGMFNRNLRKILNSSKLDKTNWITFTEDMDLSEVKWLEGRRKDLLLKSFVVWLINDVVFVLLGRFFYITESSYCKNRMFFYRKEVWKEVIDIKIKEREENGTWKRMTSEKTGTNIHTLHVPESQEMKVGHFSFFKVRLIPKAKDARVIMVSRDSHSEQTLFDEYTTISDRKLLILLTGIWNAHPDIRGSSCFGLDSVQLKWRNFIARQRLHPSTMNYFVKIDVKNCFDTIPHKKLFSVMETIMLKCHHRKIPLSEKYKGISQSTADVWTSLKGRLQNFILQIGSLFFKKLQGIPQGWRLASMLCNLFYASFERYEFPELLFSAPGDPHRRLLMRVIDDFLFVTTNIDEAVDFVRKLHQGYSEYGIIVNPSKTVLNFPLPDDIFIKDKNEIQILQHDAPFPWLGHLFLPGANLSQTSYRGFIGCGVGVEMARYNAFSHVRDFTSIQDNADSGGQKYRRTSRFELTIARSITNRISKICCDRTINSFSRLMRNAFEISVLMSLQWLCCYYCTRKAVRESDFMKSFRTFMRNVIVARFLQSKQSWVCEKSIELVCLKAAYKVVRRYPSDFKGNILRLKTEIDRIYLLLERMKAGKEKLIIVRRVTASCPPELMRLKTS